MSIVAQPGRAAVIVALLLSAASPVRSDHHEVKRALQLARCLPQELREVARSTETLVYEARCLEADRVITLVCTPQRCLADEHGRHADEEEDP